MKKIDAAIRAQLPHLTAGQRRAYRIALYGIGLALVDLLAGAALLVVDRTSDVGIALIIAFIVTLVGAQVIAIRVRMIHMDHELNEQLDAIIKRHERRTVQMQQVRDVIQYMRARAASGTVDTARLAEENRQLGEWIKAKFDELEAEMQADVRRLEES